MRASPSRPSFALAKGFATSFALGMLGTWALLGSQPEQPIDPSLKEMHALEADREAATVGYPGKPKPHPNPPKPQPKPDPKPQPKPKPPQNPKPKPPKPPHDPKPKPPKPPHDPKPKPPKPPKPPHDPKPKPPKPPKPPHDPKPKPPKPPKPPHDPKPKPPKPPHPDEAPVIHKHPKSHTVHLGQGVAFSVSASGKHLSYQWYRNNHALSDGHGNTYSIASVSMHDNGAKFNVQVSNKAGSVWSHQATLRVKDAEDKLPVITEHPASQCADVGDNVTFTTYATGKNLTYQWFKNDAAIGGATRNYYTLHHAKMKHNGARFKVRVSNSAGSVFSYAAVLSVKQNNEQKPIITQHPECATVVIGEKATFTVNAVGSNLSYQWYRDNVAIHGATLNYYTLYGSQAGDSGSRFKVQVSNSGGSVMSNRAILTVVTTDTETLPVIWESPESRTAIVGEQVHFYVSAEGKNLRYQWYRNNVAISGANYSYYAIPSVSMADDGAYYHVLVSNAAGTVTSDTAVLRVYASDTDEEILPVITEHPESQTVNEGDSVTFTVAVTGENISYQWLKNGEVVEEVTGPDYTMEEVTAADDGTEIQVVVTNGAGSVTSELAVLTVEKAEEPDELNKKW